MQHETPFHLDLVEEHVLKATLENELKPDLNNFLFPRLPGTMTLYDMERLACEIHDLIMSKWE